MRARAASLPLAPDSLATTSSTPDSAAHSAETVTALPERPAVLLPLEARARGFRNALAFKRWCRRRGVPIVKDDKLLWVRPADVDRVLAGLPVVLNSEQDDLQTAAAAAASNFVRKGI